MPTCSGVVLFAPVTVKRGRTLHLNYSPTKHMETFKSWVRRLLEVVLHVRKGAKFGVHKVDKIYAELPVLAIGKILKKEAQCSKG